MNRAAVGFLVGYLVLGIVGCQAGGWRDVSHTMDRLESDLRKDGLITIKRPDVWTENRLSAYRQEFEDAFLPGDKFAKFEPKINASMQQAQMERLGLAADVAIAMAAAQESGESLSKYLASALVQNFDLNETLTEEGFNNLLSTAVKAYLAQTSGMDPAAFAAMWAGDAAEPPGRRRTTFGKGSRLAKEGDDGGEASAGDTATGSESAADSADSGDANGEQTADSGAAADDSEDDEGETPPEEKTETPSEPRPAVRPQFKFLTDNADIVKEFLKLPGAPAAEFSPFEVEHQKRAFVQQNQLFRISNEPDDGTRMMGYRLFYMRFMVSVTPSSATQHRHSAEILLSPSYNVLDAARDWVAQYARALLRERLIRTAEFAMEMQLTTEFAELRERLSPWHRPEGVPQAIVDAFRHLSPRFTVGSFEAQEITRATLDAAVRVDPGAVAGLPAEAQTAVVNLQALNDQRARVPEAQAKALEIAELLRNDPEFGSDGEHFTSAVRSLVDNDANNKEQATKTLLTIAESEPASPMVWVAQQIEEAAARNWAQQEQVQNFLPPIAEVINSTHSAAPVIEAFTKITGKYRDLIQLCRLAYDEYAREIDYILRVPNSVSAKVDGSPIRTVRSADALATIVDRWLKPDAGSDNANATKLKQVYAAREPKQLVHDALKALVENVHAAKKRWPREYAEFFAKDKEISLAQTLLRMDARGKIAVASAICDDGKPQAESCVNLGANDLRRFFSPETWPIYTFAVAPFSEVENIAQAVHLNNELQLLLSAGMKFADIGELETALEYSRALREQFQTIQVNRTVVGLVRGEQHFGWQINPPFSMPVRREWWFGQRLAFDDAASKRMPSRTYEVFALVAVPGFLRNIEFGVHSEWTGDNRADSPRVGVANAADYLRRYRWLQKRVGEKWPKGSDAKRSIGILDILSPFSQLETEDIDDIFVGERLADRLDLIEASLPLRKMTNVFLPHGDVGERMTNTVGIDALRPEIYAIVPHVVPSHHDITLTIEGKNFDTGRVQVLVAGTEASIVRLVNDHVIVAKIPKRELLADLEGRRRSQGRKEDEDKCTSLDCEYIALVTVITPVGTVSYPTTIRSTKEEAKPVGPSLPKAEIIEPKTGVFTFGSPKDPTPIKVHLSAKIETKPGELVFQYIDAAVPKEVRMPVEVKDDKVTTKDAIVIADPLADSKPPAILNVIDKKIDKLVLVLQLDNGEARIPVKGSLSFESKLVATVDGTNKHIDLDSTRAGKVKIKLSRPVTPKKAVLLVKVSGATPPVEVELDLDINGLDVTSKDLKIGTDRNSSDPNKIWDLVGKGTTSELLLYLPDRNGVEVKIDGTVSFKP